MSQYGDVEGIFSSVRTAATPADVDAYRAAPQFAVSLIKLVVMSVCTFGLYELYWAYKQWHAARRREHENLSPFWRAFFAPLWGFSLFPRMQALTAKHGVPAPWSATSLAVAYLLLHLAWRLPDPWAVISFLTVVPLFIVQRSLNELNATVAPDAPRNDQFSGGNIAVIVLGGILLVLSVWGSLLPST